MKASTSGRLMSCLPQLAEASLDVADTQLKHLNVLGSRTATILPR